MSKYADMSVVQSFSLVFPIRTSRGVSSLKGKSSDCIRFAEDGPATALVVLAITSDSGAGVIPFHPGELTL